MSIIRLLFLLLICFQFLLELLRDEAHLLEVANLIGLALCPATRAVKGVFLAFVLRYALVAEVAPAIEHAGQVGAEVEIFVADLALLVLVVHGEINLIFYFFLIKLFIFSLFFDD